MKQNIRTFLAAALVAFGLAAYAGEFTYEWHTTDVITGPNAPATITQDDVLSGVKAYLIDADRLSQQTLLTSFFEDAGYTPFERLVNANNANLGSAVVNQGVVGNTPFTPPSEVTDEKPGHAYFVLTMQQDGESLLYFSGYSSINSTSYAGEGTLVLNAFSSHGDINRTTTFLDDPPTAGAGGGWYGAAVPEPTSGVLMLLGLAALALRRRRA